MELRHNFFSVITLGNFNPAILKPDFLYNYCDFPIDIIIKSADITPVVSKLDFEDVIFVLELEKFQIVEKNIENLFNIKILGYLSKYLKTLEYTPIYVMGINFNSSILAFESNIFNKLDDKFGLMNFLKISELTYGIKEKISENRSGRLSWDLSFISSDDYINRIAFKLDDDKITVNHNFELRDIECKKEKIFKISSEYLKLAKQYTSFMNYLVGGA